MQAEAKTHTSTFLAARWILPIDSEPVENGVVELADGKIRAVESRTQFAKRQVAERPTDYGEAVIMPGLINMHTHVDYSALRRFDTDSGMFQWIGGLVAAASKWSPDQWHASAELGVRELALAGTTCVADSSFTGTAAAHALSSIGLRGVIGLELFGSNSAQSERAFDLWLSKREALEASLSKYAGAQETIQLTVSPHAPYTVCPALWTLAVKWAWQANLPVLCHLSESLEECRWIASDSKEVESFLSKFDPNFALNKRDGLAWKGQGRTPVEHLEHHRLLTDTTVAAHAVHLSDRDIRLLSTHRVKVAHCPRSNARLRNGIAPLSRLLKAGVSVSFGTDSLASTDSLDVLAEARFGWNLHRAIDPAFDFGAREALYSLTLGAARALNLDSKIGSIEPGKEADLAVFSLDSGGDAARDPYSALLYGQPALKDLYVRGRQIVKAGALC